MKATRPAQYSRSPAGQIVPHDHHGDAAGQTDQDQPHHVFLVPGKKGDGQQKHQHGPDHPVLDQGQQEHLHIAKHLPQMLVFDLGQGRVHHQNQADGDRNVGRAHLEIVDDVDAREEIAAHNPDEHGQKYPQGQIAVQK